MKIEIWSDVMCPYCYIGKRHFEAALEKFPDRDHLEIEWKSFQLDPGITEEMSGTNVMEYLSKRMGANREQTRARLDGTVEMAKNAGLDFNFEIAVVANSLKAHRMIQLAKENGKGDAAEERLFRAYFTEGRNFGDTTVLIELGKEIGLDETDILKALDGDDYSYKVETDLQEARQLGIQGVPFYVFDRKYGVSGAQPVDAFFQTLEKSFAEWRQANPMPKLDVIEGKACDLNGNCI